jgi:lipopolysaccharide transport system ATP-binding protein
LGAATEFTSVAAANVASLALRASDLAKRFRLGPRPAYRTLREALRDAARAPWRALHRRDDDERDWLLALDGVSFEVRRGEVVGVIGRNGAGKSTLLKVLARITAPTRGSVDLWGRVGALLEVGTGFHPELSGRDNIFLSGAVLGLKRAEIRARFDAIVAFAEVERFLDTEVKHYSSGMFMRLAFAVAAHLEPEILLVDEVLAVGDAGFQRKCLAKMEDVGREGRTVIFVSHNMPAVTRLCPRTLLLERGRVLKDGPSHEVVEAYLRSGLHTTAAREWSDPGASPGDAVARLRAVRVRDHEGRVSAALDVRRALALELEYDVLRAGRVVPNVHVLTGEGTYAFVASDAQDGGHRRVKPPGRYVSRALVPGNFLAEGTYVVGAALSTMDPVAVHAWERDAVAFQVIDTFQGDSARGDYGGPMPGVVRPLLAWHTERTGEERA